MEGSETTSGEMWRKTDKRGLQCPDMGRGRGGAAGESLFLKKIREATERQMGSVKPATDLLRGGLERRLRFTQERGRRIVVSDAYSKTISRKGIAEVREVRKAVDRIQRTMAAQGGNNIKGPVLWVTTGEVAPPCWSSLTENKVSTTTTSSAATSTTSCGASSGSEEESIEAGSSSSAWDSQEEVADCVNLSPANVRWNVNAKASGFALGGDEPEERCNMHGTTRYHVHTTVATSTTVPDSTTIGPNSTIQHQRSHQHVENAPEQDPRQSQTETISSGPLGGDELNSGLGGEFVFAIHRELVFEPPLLFAPEDPFLPEESAVGHTGLIITSQKSQHRFSHIFRICHAHARSSCCGVRFNNHVGRVTKSGEFL